MIRCACLVKVVDSNILLVRVRNNMHWYLPGGKIEAGETPEKALSRELLEELGITVIEELIAYKCTVIGPAYGIADEVELICFSAFWNGEAKPLKEISEVDWIRISDKEKLAPAVNILIKNHIENDANQL